MIHVHAWVIIIMLTSAQMAALSGSESLLWKGRIKMPQTFCVSDFERVVRGGLRCFSV